MKILINIGYKEKYKSLLLWIFVCIFCPLKRDALTRSRSHTQVMPGKILIGQIKARACDWAVEGKHSAESFRGGREGERREERRTQGTKMEEEEVEMEQIHVAWRSRK